MAQYRVTDSELTGIADVIRLKGGTSDPLVFPSGFASAVEAIETQGTYVSKIITENGEYDPADDNVDAFSHVTVSVPTGSTPVLVSKSISQNGIYNPVDDNADAYSQVVVNVSGGGGGDDYYKITTGQASGGIHDSSIQSIHQNKFESLPGLEWFIGENVTEIGSYAFRNNSNLSYVSFPSCTTLAIQVFNGCNNLQTVVLDKVTIIQMSCFANCSKLTSIDFSNVISVYSEAFRSCRSLSVARFSKLNAINGSSAFANCIALKSLCLLSTTVVSLQRTNTFASTPFATSGYGGYGSIYVPASLVDAYKSASNWSAYADRITSYVEG